MKKVIAGVVVAVAIVAGVAFYPLHKGPAQETAVRGCGVERWAVKTLQDPSAALVDHTPIPATLADLARIPAAPKNAKARLTAETKTYHIDAQLVSVKQEADNDYHLVLTWGGFSMIAEAPDPKCAPNSTVLEEMTTVRQQITDLCHPSRSTFTPCPHNIWVTGVAFLDFLHGQTGVAPNGVEIHPITGFYVTQ